MFRWIMRRKLLQQTAENAQQLGLTESEVAEAYWQAMQWVRQLTTV